MKLFNTMLVLLVFSIGTVYAQKTISGAVTDENGDAIIGATVLMKGSASGTITDIDGNYSIEVPEDATTLLFSYIGYATQEVEITGTTINVTLLEGVDLEKVVVTALGVKRSEKALGYAIQEVDGEEVAKSNTANFVDALNGKVAGLQVTSASGAAGASSRVVLRGPTSLNGNNEALIVVDGVRINNEELTTERSLAGVAYSNRGIDINPNDIESVVVLKGAAASALYGAEGARGVLVITTKKGKGGKTKNGISVDYTSTYTLSQVNKLPELQNKYAQGTSWFSADGVTPEYRGPETGWPTSWGPLIDTLYWDGDATYQYDNNGKIVGQSDPNAGQKVTPYDNLNSFFQLGHAWKNALSVSGGGTVATYRFSFSHLKQDGIIPNNTFERINVGLNSQANFLDNKMKIGTSINYVNSGGNRIQQGSNTSGIMLGLLRTPSTFDNANGLADPVNNSSSYYFSSDKTQRNYRGGGGYDNPYWVVNNSPFVDRVNRFIGNLNASYEFTKWLTLSTKIGTDFYSDTRKQSFEIGSRTLPNGQVIEDQYTYHNINAFVNVLGSKYFGDDHSLSYNIGTEFFTTRLNQQLTQGDGLSFPGFMHLSNTGSVTSITDLTRTKTYSLFASVEYGFKNMLYLSLTARNDWLSTLIAPTKKFKAGDLSVFYPSASLSFVFTELLPDNDILSFGKVRFSFAQVGGGAPTAYLTGTNFTNPEPGTINALNDGWTDGILFPFNGQAAYIYDAVLGNPNLKPSRTTDYEVGADLRFFKGRLNLDATYYYRQSANQILVVPIAATSGFQRAVLNSGSLSTNGVDIVLNATPVKTKDFRWDIGINFTHWKTVVDALADGVERQYLDGFTGSSIYNVVGQEYGQIYGGAFMRVNDTDANGNPIFNVDKPYNPNGQMVIDSASGYPLVDPLERPIGNPNPDFLLGINNTLSYKGLSLSFLLDWKQGGQMWNGTQGALTYFGMSKLTENRDMPGDAPNYVFEGVTQDGSTNTKPVLRDENWYTGNGGGFGSVAEHFVQETSWFRLRQLSLSYTLSSKLLSKTPFTGITISFVGRNLFLITPYEGIDPETSLVGSSSNGQGLDYFQMPNTRSFALSLNVKF
ncbi:SusC/RagA family TonB-linked outer membrane protein [Aureispira sp. CCB-E]|uniref:SusC/RagA family TonB-linked outer membrane protein n=1 Tax=Aureispira sp. CCB-E TaxID=3051121 RepID=UPI002869359F|nr:SusC/RagA family TonB-linked outer membrane protein [Aureispira sp. CCB-E]WMX13017.1 SusC/RagA family TonB-linked outer membrane protein [Aureispira sp. CCB-E]